MWKEVAMHLLLLAARTPRKSCLPVWNEPQEGSIVEASECRLEQGDACASHERAQFTKLFVVTSNDDPGILIKPETHLSQKHTHCLWNHTKSIHQLKTKMVSYQESEDETASLIRETHETVAPSGNGFSYGKYMALFSIIGFVLLLGVSMSDYSTVKFPVKPTEMVRI